MVKSLIVGVVVFAAACGGDKKDNTDNIIVIDSGSGSNQVDAPVQAACNVLTQMGCQANEKCTWIHSTEAVPGTAALGAIGCAPAGTAADGEACTFGPAGATGYDNCKGGDICVHSTCKQICDNNNGTGPMCGSNFACVTYDSLFANHGSTTTPAGACDPTCNPLDDNDFDGSGTMFTKTGSACGSDPTIGCYGGESTAHPTFFTCSTPVKGSELLTHRSIIPDDLQFLNTCMPGYGIAFAGDATGSMNLDCYAFCAPGDAYMGNTGTQEPNGKTTAVAPAHTHRCNNNDALGNFGATPNTTGSNGEHCMYSWRFEVDDAGTLHESPTSNTVGICWDHSKYQYDKDGDGTVDTVVEPCVTSPISGGTASTAVELGCVNTALIPTTFNGKMPKPHHYIQNFPERIVLPAHE